MMETDSFFDDTPTPTRFIRSCEEIGLFQDLQSNPFDETFRIAVESSPNDLSILRESLSKPVTEETLNTPNIITFTKTDGFQNVYSIVDENDGDDFIIPADHFLIESVDQESACADKDMSDESEEVEVIEEPIQQNGFTAHIKPQLATVNTIVTALTSNSPNTYTYTINSNAIKNGTIGNFILSPQISSNNASLHSNSNNKQLVLPKTVIASTKDIREHASEFVSSNAVKNVTSKESDFLYQVSTTKLPIVSSAKNVIFLPTRNCITKPSTSQPIKPAVHNEQEAQKSNGDSEVKAKLRNLLKTNSSQLIEEPVRREARKRQMSVDTNGTVSVLDEKREYSRERNRMAQKRCRKKKKMWLMEMKREKESIVHQNQNLQVEVGTLKAEIAHLKTLLLAHRNCSVTRAMFKADLSAILNSDISEIAENVEIPIPDGADDSDDSRFKYGSIVNQQVNHNNLHQQINQHIQNIHLHVPSSPSPNEDVFESICARGKNSQHETKQFTQTKKLIFDSKVVPIKPDDRSAGVLHKQINPSLGRANVVKVGKNANVITVNRVDACPG